MATEFRQLNETELHALERAIEKGGLLKLFLRLLLNGRIIGSHDYPPNGYPKSGNHTDVYNLYPTVINSTADSDINPRTVTQNQGISGGRIALRQCSHLSPREGSIYNHYDKTKTLYQSGYYLVGTGINAVHFWLSVIVSIPVAWGSFFALGVWPSGLVGAIFAFAGAVSVVCTLSIGMREHPST